ncbi:MAG: hypothetical protein AD742_04600 [Methylibium sp. NZG]|nr:MAG: hypothetical protein AD742_04600 [Methylibium sp. NZG]
MPTLAKTPAKAPASAPAKTGAASKRVAQKTAPKAPVTQAAAAKAKAPAKASKKAAQAASKPPKLKVPLVRDSFTMPAADFELVAALKLRALKLMRPTKKSELLRAGLHALSALGDTRLLDTLNALTPLKPGRPKKAD